MTVIDRFLKYVSFDTQSDETTDVTPSTAKQMVFANYLKFREKQANSSLSSVTFRNKEIG